MSYEYWQQFYSSKDCLRVPAAGSPFAKWVCSSLPSDSSILEVGCGTGRDALEFVAAGHRVHAVDHSPAGLSVLEQRAVNLGGALTTSVINVSDLTDVLGLLADLPSNRPLNLYARFFLHAIDDATRENFWILASAIGRAHGTVWLEFRTAKDDGTKHEFGAHYRNYLPLAKVLAEALAIGLYPHYIEEGTGMATFGAEDPVVARLVLHANPTAQIYVTSKQGLAHA